ncbi:urease accessory protein UreD [Ideonella sp. BN130291]|uniref:urease accessory protein UreD n=1 Tax=Ideonella sp. BN130291 TaxID=3112940 RepID=UPI002E253028|nr:urease accessory protein UreD [Ideonella sp. BN130291]
MPAHAAPAPDPAVPPGSTGWHGRLALHYQLDAQGSTTAHDRHHGPLRVLQRLYPEGPAVCHHVLVHPPGGIVGGDRLEISAELDAGTHALITTPGATRFYRSAGALAHQSAKVSVADGARLEWLPLESIAYDGCLAHNQVQVQLAPGAQMIGWDVLALGLPAAAAPFQRGSFLQELELPGVWLERGRIDAADRRLLESPLGLAGRPVLATAWFGAGSALAPSLREALLEGTRDILAGHTLAALAGCTSPQPQCVVLRVLADQVEPALQLLGAVRACWRQVAWGMAAHPPRIWRT